MSEYDERDYRDYNIEASWTYPGWDGCWSGFASEQHWREVCQELEERLPMLRERYDAPYKPGNWRGMVELSLNLRGEPSETKHDALKDDVHGVLKATGWGGPN